MKERRIRLDGYVLRMKEKCYAMTAQKWISKEGKIKWRRPKRPNDHL